jgi:hypothetical protein
MLVIVTGFSNTQVCKILNNSTYDPSRLFWYDHQAWAQGANPQHVSVSLHGHFLSCQKIIWYLM